MRIKINEYCIPIYRDLHIEDIGLRLTITEIIFLNLYNVLYRGSSL